ncbi:hypothetical protein CDD83_6010 [Cordyceps sp. RAO-2017]|nr:hypothetical protein CDD83_6010 [Cordyceps sp. RAO-2017]
MGGPDPLYEAIPASKAVSKILQEVSQQSVFWRGDSRSPEVIFGSVFQASGSNMNLEDHLLSKGGSGYVSVSRARNIAEAEKSSSKMGIDMRYVYIITPEKLPDGYWVPDVQWKGETPPLAKQEFEIAVPRAVPQKSIAGVYQGSRVGPQSDATAFSETSLSEDLAVIPEENLQQDLALEAETVSEREFVELISAYIGNCQPEVEDVTGKCAREVPWNRVRRRGSVAPRRCDSIFREHGGSGPSGGDDGHCASDRLHYAADGGRGSGPGRLVGQLAVLSRGRLDPGRASTAPFGIVVHIVRFIIKFKVTSRCRELLVLLPGMLRDSAAESLSVAADKYKNDFAEQLATTEMLERYSATTPWGLTEGDRINEFRVLAQTLTTYLRSFPLPLPSNLELAHIIGHSKGLENAEFYRRRFT